ncbi:PQQ-dependent sugar dehydrogenase [Agromyces sp. NPDC058484]|uniref:PQQ-dependent sugar dehydrogenase n=1 Tax=Agromyces sp. NPDC058484 TaxID=3346524 RepID=UPI0036612F39
MRQFAALAAGAVALAAIGFAGSPAAAHDGHDHDAEPGGTAALDWTNYEKVLLTKNVGEPIDLAVLPDSRVLHTARNGDIRLTDPTTGVTKVVNTIPVYANSEDGLQTVALDPDFENNGWVYLVYAPVDADGDGAADTPTGSAPNTLPAGADESYWEQWEGVNRLSRFQWNGSGLDLASEQVILDVDVQRGQCCHVGADIDFDGDGNLYLSTGDNTPAGTPGASGFAPNNDAPNMNPGFDARRGAGNTNDLRGKILRISVEEDGTYTIPEGNLFAPGTELTRPEIFIMGVRNPFRMEVDPETNSISWGDYGPDATKAAAASAGRGPMGIVEWNAASLADPHNSGWPYATGDNFAYNDWDFAAAAPGAFFDPANLVNDSRWNTGLTQIPAARAATLYYGDNPGDQPWDELVNFGAGSGQGPMGGPVYHYDEANPSAAKFPAYWDGKAFMGEFSQDYIAAFTMDRETFGVTHIQDFLPNSALAAAAQPTHDNPMDMEFGPDGSLYVLDYGDGFFRANPDSGLYRIDYVEGNKSPQARFTATPDSSSGAPLEVEFDASASSDPEDGALTYEWDVDGDGSFDRTGATASHTYTELGAYTARLRVTDPQGKFALTSRSISVGNQAPEVNVEFPENGGFVDWGQAVPYRVTATDAEDGNETVCSRVAWTYGLGHDEHAHPEVSGTGCTGAWRTNASSPEHGPGALLYGAVVVTYTDAGANGLPAAAGEATVRLNPKLQQAEHAIARQGVVVYADETASGGSAIRGLGTNGGPDFVRFDPVSFSGIDGAIVRANGGGEIELRWGAADATPFAVATIPAGAGWKDVEIQFDAPEGTGALYVTSSDELALDSITMTGAGVADVAAPTVEHTLTPAEPTGVGGVFNEPVRFAVQPADNGALASVQYSRDGGATWTNLAANQQYGVTFSQNGRYDLTYRATDTGGNVSQTGTVSFKVDLNAPNEPTVDSRTSVSLDAARVTYGAPGAVAVSVTGEGGIPTGEVVVTSGETEVGRGTLDAEGKATIALAADLAVGTHTLRATYGADEVFKTSSDTGRLTVSKATSTSEVTVSPNPVKPAVAAKAAIAVASSTGIVPTGEVSVTVKRGSTTVTKLTGELDADGKVTVTLPKLGTGTYQVQAVYDGSAGVSKSTATAILTVR